MVPVYMYVGVYNCPHGNKTEKLLGVNPGYKLSEFQTSSKSVK